MRIRSTAIIVFAAFACLCSLGIAQSEDDGANVLATLELSDRQVDDVEVQVLGTAMWSGCTDFAVSGDYVYMAMPFGLQVIPVVDSTFSEVHRRYFMPGEFTKLLATDSLLFNIKGQTVTCQRICEGEYSSRVLCQYEFSDSILDYKALGNSLYFLTEASLSIFALIDTTDFKPSASVDLELLTEYGSELAVIPGHAYVASGHFYSISELQSEHPIVSVVQEDYDAVSIAIADGILWLLTCDERPIQYKRNTRAYVLGADSAHPQLVRQWKGYELGSQIHALRDELYHVWEGVDDSVPPLSVLDGLILYLTYKDHKVLLRDNMRFILRPWPLASMELAVAGHISCHDKDILGGYKSKGELWRISSDSSAAWIHTSYGVHTKLTLPRNGGIQLGPALKSSTHSHWSKDKQQEATTVIRTSEFPVVASMTGISVLPDESEGADRLSYCWGPMYALDVALGPTHAFYACGPFGLCIYDVADPYNPHQSSRVGVTARSLVLRDTLLFMYEHTTRQYHARTMSLPDSGSPGEIVKQIGVYNCSEPDHLRKLVTIPLTGQLRLCGDTLAVYADSQVTFVDVSDPSQPGVLTCYHVADEISDLVFDDRFMYWTGSEKQLHVVSKVDIADMSPVCQVDIPGKLRDIDIHHDEFLVASEFGLLRLRVVRGEE